MWDPAGVPDDAIERGAYVLRESYKGRDELPDLILIATGSEVHICNDAAEAARGRGRRDAARVSMPCMDRFAEQDQALPRQGAAAGRARARVRSRR